MDKSELKRLGKTDCDRLELRADIYQALSDISIRSAQQTHNLQKIINDMNSKEQQIGIEIIVEIA